MNIRMSLGEIDIIDDHDHGSSYLVRLCTFVENGITGRRTMKVRDNNKAETLISGREILKEKDSVIVLVGSALSSVLFWLRGIAVIGYSSVFNTLTFHK